MIATKRTQTAVAFLLACLLGAPASASLITRDITGMIFSSANSPADVGTGTITGFVTYDEAFLNTCTLYSAFEPCSMCSGTIYWAGIGRVVFGVTEARLLELTGDNPENLTMALSCRDVLAAGQREVVVEGPFPDLEDEIIRSHDGFW